MNSEHDRRTNYQAGADFERKARDTLYERHAAILVVRAAGSHGKADLVAFFKPTAARVTGKEIDTVTYVPNVWLVQVKKDGRLSSAEHDELVTIANRCGVPAYLAYHDRGAGVAFSKLATNPQPKEEG